MLHPQTFDNIDDISGYDGDSKLLLIFRIIFEALKDGSRYRIHPAHAELKLTGMSARRSLLGSSAQKPDIPTTQPCENLWED